MRYLILFCLLVGNSLYAGEEYHGVVSHDIRSNEYSFKATIDDNGLTKTFKLGITHIRQESVLKKKGVFIINGDVAICGSDNILLIKEIRDDVVSNAQTSGTGKDQSP